MNFNRTLILICIFIQTLISAQENNVILADRFFKNGDSLSRKSSIIIKAGFDSSFNQETINPKMLDSSNYYFHKAELIYRNEKEWTKYLNSIEFQSRNLFRLNLADSAIIITQKGLKEIENNLLEQTSEFYKHYFFLSSYYFKHKADFNKAIIFCKRSISLARNILPKDNKFLAIYYSTLGMYYTNKGQYDSSMYFYRFILDSLNTTEHPSEYPINNIYKKISEDYQAQGKYDLAIEYMEKAIHNLKNNSPAIISYKNDLGVLYQFKGDYDKALECYMESIKLIVKPLGENSITVASTFNNIGTIYVEKGDYEKALEYLNKGMYCHLNAKGNTHPILITDYSNISYTYYSLNNLQASVQYIQKALEVSRISLPENHPGNIRLFKDAAFFMSKAHLFDTALYYINKFSTLINKNDSAQNKTSLKAEYYKSLGAYYFEKHDFEKSFEYYKLSESLYATILDSKSPAIIKLNNLLGNVCIQQNNFEKAVEFYNTALRCNNVIISSGGDDNYSNAKSEYELFESLKGKSVALKHCCTTAKDPEKLKLSFTVNLSCIDLFNKLRYKFKSDLSKIFLTETSYDIFDMAIETALELSKYPGYNYYKNIAFDIIEKSKNGILMNAISETKAKHYAGVPDSLLKIEESLKKGIENYNILISQEFEKEKPDSLKISYWQNNLFSLKEKFLIYIQDLETNFPKYHNLKFNTHTISIPDIQKKIDHQTSVIEFFKGKNSITIFVISKDTFNVATTQIDSSFDEEIANLYKVLTRQANLVQKKNHTRFLELSSKIYDYIITPVAKNISETKHLVLIPDGNLYYIPFEILMKKPEHAGSFSEYDYLIKKFEITYHYSATLCFATDTLKNRNYSTSFTGFAPMFNDSTESTFLSKYRKINSTDILTQNRLLSSNISRLIYAEEEVKSINNLFVKKGKSSSLYLGKNASETIFKDVSSNISSRILHIATHGIANENRPNLSALLFSQLPDNSSDDGILFAEEITNMEINSELVVLSACESGIGKLIKGEGMMALNRSFLYAGINKLMFSLWKVNDRETCNMMIEFYKKILDGEPYRTALRNAKLKMISDPVSSNPSIWGSFILIDN